MSRKRASLAGKGVEILFGAAAEDSTEESLPPQDKDTTLAESAGPKEEQPAAGAPSEDVDDWAVGLAAEAQTATAREELDALIPPGPVAEPEQPAADALPQAPDVNAPIFADEPEMADLPALATIPAQPAGDLPALATTPAQPAEDLPPLATTPAQPAEDLPPLATTPIQPIEALPPLATTPAQPAETPPFFKPAPAYPAAPEEELVIDRPPATVPDPGAEESTPPAPMYTAPVPMPEMPPTSPLSQPPANLPAPREKPEAYDPAVRARIYGALYDAYTEKPSAEQLEPDGPTSPDIVLTDIKEYEAGQPSRQRQEDEILRTVGAEQRRILWKRLFELYQEVPDVLCMDELQDEALQLLHDAQDILMEKPRQFDVALYKVSQAESIINRRKNINHWTDTYGWATFAYEVIWIIGLAAAILFAPAVVGWVESIVGEMPYFISVSGLWMTAAWGSAGGVLGALYSLYWHAAKVKDFHKQYLMWYVVQPVIGILIGAFIYLITGAGFIGGTGENVVTGETSVIPLFRYAIAAIASFRQRFILEVVDRLVQLLTSPFQAQEAPANVEQRMTKPPESPDQE